MTSLRQTLVASTALAVVATPALAQSALAADAGSGANPYARTAEAVLPVVGQALPALDFDSRAGLPRLAPTAAQRRAVAALRGATVTWNASGTPAPSRSRTAP